MPMFKLMFKNRQDCTVRAYGIRQNGISRCSSIPVTHQNVDKGVSFPRVDVWFKKDIRAFTASFLVVQRSGRRHEFIVYFTRNPRRYRPSRAVLREMPGTYWHGEFLVFRRAVHSDKLINVRAKDHKLIWPAVKGGFRPVFQDVATKLVAEPTFLLTV
ncbi:hypothetical protein BV25DRAFT_1843632 [Artomyces pyxidatus]|uniref:Uncharacterized protein n=1 Tax=Artomyces pyxidatus TaxID=48021 RepID=A0ACB8SFE4_9AGAM|nr:hypothetical protein BV25DRAFT_1843632 [Artomyces pyxidatus]